MEPRRADGGRRRRQDGRAGRHGGNPVTAGKALTRAALKHFPLPRVEDGGKESKGRILIVAGSREVPGAALLCATAAMRSGAGKLKIATSQSVAVPVAIA